MLNLSDIGDFSANCRISTCLGARQASDPKGTGIKRAVGGADDSFAG